MSYFSAPALAKDPDMTKIRSYIMQLNQQLQYSLSSLDPEDNFSQEFLVSYQETDKTISQLEIQHEWIHVRIQELGSRGIH